MNTNQMGLKTVIVPWLLKAGQSYVSTNERLYSTVNIGEGTLGQSIKFFQNPKKHRILAVGIGAPANILATSIDTNMSDFGKLARGQDYIVRGLGIVLKMRADDEAAAAAAMASADAAHPPPPFPFVNSNIVKRFQRDVIVSMNVNNSKLFEAPLSFFNQGVGGKFSGSFGPAVGNGVPGFNVATNGGTSRHSRRLWAHFPTLSTHERFDVEMKFPKGSIRGLALGNLDAADAVVPGINCHIEAKCYLFGDFRRKA